MKKMKFWKIAALVAIPVSLVSCGQQINLGQVADMVLGSGPLSQGEIAGGLRQALEQGVTTGTASASRTDGFFRNALIRIAVPQEIQNVANTLRSIGLGSEVDKFELALNRGAEQAAGQASSIFIGAIRQMTISDAIGILRGDKDAATQYLRRTTSQQLANAFAPIVTNALNQTEATRYYGTIAQSYNALPFVKPIATDLTAYATQKAMDGIFTLVAQEEARIRENPVARTTELLRRVFGSPEAQGR